MEHSNNMNSNAHKQYNDNSTRLVRSAARPGPLYIYIYIYIYMYTYTYGDLPTRHRVPVMLRPLGSLS